MIIYIMRWNLQFPNGVVNPCGFCIDYVFARSCEDLHNNIKTSNFFMETCNDKARVELEPKISGFLNESTLIILSDWNLVKLIKAGWTWNNQSQAK